MNNLVKVRLHHDLGREIGENWDLAIKSVSEAVHAIESMTHKLNKYLLKKDKENIKYQVIVNGDIIDGSDLNDGDINKIKESEFCLNKGDLKTIDIVPVIEGANSKALGVILGVILIIVGVIVGIATGIGFALVVAGLGLIVGSLLSKPPRFEDFREIEQGGKTSYLYGGPANIVGEGGPVPIGYGRLIVGSQTITASYVIRQYSSTNSSIYYDNIY